MSMLYLDNMPEPEAIENKPATVIYWNRNQHKSRGG